ncbi:hypothetical protein ASC77_04890 [Nocardioides sp. Root1257]|uniref:calcium-binding protein n=1 Tax=unclassified Nocardioides TaxID=2615069 RepID=UPI0006FE3095|nr:MULTISPECIES: calcium-binding protein [unclassified Nocardioides]KQW53608.1 hypothetical protein ASC77_04890 [Nocardioides sp. Root1257]KRC56294.1 hypothetical protein ASE24_04890 [Nocardioides sp. Root224]
MGVRTRGCVLTVSIAGLAAVLAGLGGCSEEDTKKRGASRDRLPSTAVATSGPEGTATTARAGPVRVLCGNRRATLIGTSGADHLHGTRGRDVIASLGGDDVIDRLGPRDRVCAGPGDDRVDATRATWSTDEIDLGPGDDQVRMIEAVDTLGGPGADRIVVVRGSGSFSGGPGKDFLRAVSARQPHGYPENAPCLTYRHARRPVHVDLEAGRARGQGQDTVIGFHCVHGSRYGDVIVGTDTRDGITSGGGDDLVRTGPGPDAVATGGGDDRVYLGPGFDYANGEWGDDRLYGGDGPDVLEGWSQSDYVEGGPGNDQVYGAIFCAIGGNSYDTAGLMDGAPDELFGGPGDDWLVGDKGNDRIDGDSGYDQAQPGYHDGRIDWVEGVERLVEGCLTSAFMDKPFDPTDTSYFD